MNTASPALVTTAKVRCFAATLSLLCGSALSIPAAKAASTASHAIYKSTDEGRTWSRSDKGLPGTARINAFGSLGNAIIAGTDAGIFTSKNQGGTWSSASLPGGLSNRIHCLAAVERRLYAGTDRSGILISSDQGETWSRLPGFPAGKVRCLLQDDKELYAGTETDGVFRSLDGGESWMRLNQGLPEQAQVFSLAMVKNSLFAGLYGKGLYVWNAPQSQWAKVDPVTPLALAVAGDTLIAGHNPGGLYWSSDLGSTWSRPTASIAGGLDSTLLGSSNELSINAPVWELGSTDDLSVAGAASGIFYSKDRGRTWTRAREGLPEESPGVSFFVTQNLILAGTTVKKQREK